MTEEPVGFGRLNAPESRHSSAHVFPVGALAQRATDGSTVRPSIQLPLQRRAGTHRTRHRTHAHVRRERERERGREK